MRYEPDANPPIDFTWEREWRVQSEQLPVAPNIAKIVVPSREWADRLADAHNEMQDHLVHQYSQIMDPLLAEQYRENQWQFGILE